MTRILISGHEGPSGRTALSRGPPGASRKSGNHTLPGPTGNPVSYLRTPGPVLTLLTLMPQRLEVSREVTGARPPPPAPGKGLVLGDKISWLARSRPTAIGVGAAKGAGLRASEEMQGANCSLMLSAACRSGRGEQLSPEVPGNSSHPTPSVPRAAGTSRTFRGLHLTYASSSQEDSRRPIRPAILPGAKSSRSLPPQSMT